MPDPTIADLYAELNGLLCPDTAPATSTTDSNARDILARAIAEIKDLRQRAADTTWREVADEPPPQSTEVLFYGGGYWVGYAEMTTFHDLDTGEETAEVAYYFEGDLMDGDAPTLWCHIPPDDAGDGE
jgi:hypothetical protein